MRYYLIAGERSGDVHGGNLVKALQQQDPGGTFQGFGGDEMRRAGVQLSVHYQDLAVMGFISLVSSLPRIMKFLKFCKTDILKFKPDVVILIDYGGFNLRIAPFVKSNNIPVFYYIPPKVWAWNQSRTQKIKQSVDRVFSILPFEPEFFRQHGCEVDYVGNPVLDAIKAFQPNPDFLERHRLTDDKKIVALLPGSRAMELKRIVPLMADLADRNLSIQFVVAKVSNLTLELYRALIGKPNVTFVEEETYDLLSHAQAAIVTSGTATLETGIFRVPQVVVYKTSQPEYLLVKSLVKVKFISLVNLIAGKEVIRELIQHQANKDDVQAELQRLLTQPDSIKSMKSEYEQIYKMLDTGSASENTARLMTNYLRQWKG